MYKAVIFDLDGTLLDTIGDLAAAGNYTLAQMGCPQHSVECYKHMVGNGIPKLLERMLPEDRRGEARQKRAAELFFPYYNAHKEDTTVPYAGIRELLAVLHREGILLGVVSNKENTLTQSVIAHYFPDTFDAVAGHMPGTPAKPDPHLVSAMCAGFGCDPQDAILVGDSNVDIFTAHNAHMEGCGVLWGFRSEDELRKAGADCIVSDIGALRMILTGE